MPCRHQCCSAAVSLIPPNVVKDWTVSPSTVLLEMEDGQTLVTLGEVTIPIALGDLQTTHRFLVGM